MSYSPQGAGAQNDPVDDSGVVYVKCSRCKGSGIDPDSARSHQDDEWDCIECDGYGDIPIR